MSKKIYSIISIIIGIMLIFLLQNEVYAASVTMSASSTKVEPEKTVTITANIKSSASWVLDVSSTGGALKKNESRVGATESGTNENKTVTLGTFTTDKEGTYKITLSGYVVDGDTLSKTNINESVSIVVEKTPVVTTPDPEPETPTTPTPEPKPETPETNNTQTEIKKSSEARLSNLGITPNDFSGFKRDKYEYSTTVPNDIAEVEVYATAKDSKAKVEGIGKVTLKEGNNTVKVKVTAEDGTTIKTYTLTINRKTAAEQAKEDSEARLKSLGIKPKEYDFTGFDSDKTEYSVEVPNEVEEIEVYATAMKSSAQITGIGMITLEEGLNELKIESIAADGTKKTYMLNVTRKEAEEVVGATGTTGTIFGLSSLAIEGLKLSPSFKPTIYEYTAELTSVTVGNSLNITTKSDDEDATVEIIGNENLQDGENVITILVKNEETEENATYQITVNKNIIVEEVEEQMSWLKPSTWGKEEYIKIAIIVVLIILIIIAVVLKINISKGSLKDLPGADELDRAIAEHQELSEENNYSEDFEENNYELKNNDEQNYIEEIAVNRFGIEEDIEVKTKRRGRHF